MRKIKDQNLAQLLMQLRFTPEKKRRKQLDAVEELLTIIDKDKEYPFEFVCFRITGFHPRTDTETDLIRGNELLEDLRIFISKLSGRFARPAAELSQKLYTIPDLAKAMHVSTKTIYRWRKRGLPARKYVFGDGIKRLGFLQSTVDKFLKTHADLVSQTKGFVRLTDGQKRQIIRQAARLTATTNLSRHQIIKKITAQTGKSHETIRYTLLNYERAHSDKSALKKSTGAIQPVQAAEVYKLYKQGCPIAELMERFSRNKSSIYRIINRRRAKVLLTAKIEFVPSDEFFDLDAEQKIPAEQPGSTQPPARRDIEPASSGGGPAASAFLRAIKDTPVLNREREVELFRRYNYLKFLACQNRARIRLAAVSGVMLNRMEGYLSQAEEIKKRIIEANLRLVVSIARKHTAGGANLLDLVSEGNISLMRAVEKFDYSRGFRFATFASWIIAKDFARKISATTDRLGKGDAASLADIRDDLMAEEPLDFAAMEQAHRSLAQVVEDNLTQRERYVIVNRFGLVGSPIRKQTKTLHQIGQELNLSKERIRQIELTALQKLRQSLSSEEFELLTG